MQKENNQEKKYNCEKNNLFRSVYSTEHYNLFASL